MQECLHNYLVYVCICLCVYYIHVELYVNVQGESMCKMYCVNACLYERVSSMHMYMCMYIHSVHMYMLSCKHAGVCFEQDHGGWKQVSGFLLSPIFFGLVKIVTIVGFP